MLRLTLKGRVVSKEPGKLRGQYIATAELEDGSRVKFDVIEGLLDVDVNDNIDIILTDEKPPESELDGMDFCGHGYLVEDEGSAGKTIFSIWGILFVFSSKQGLHPGRKYYLCIKRYK